MKKINQLAVNVFLLIIVLLSCTRSSVAQNGFDKPKKEYEKPPRKVKYIKVAPSETTDPTTPPKVSNDPYAWYELLSDQYLSTIKISLTGIKVNGDWDWQWGDDHRMDLYGAININGVNVWKVSNVDCRLPQNNYGDGSYVNFNVDPAAANEANATRAGSLNINTQGYTIDGTIGDWDLVTSAETSFHEFIPFSDIRTKHLINNTITITVNKNIELGHPAAVQIILSFSEPNSGRN